MAQGGGNQGETYDFYLFSYIDTLSRGRFLGMIFLFFCCCLLSMIPKGMLCYMRTRETEINQ